jgi:hypothetical protein
MKKSIVIAVLLLFAVPFSAVVNLLPKTVIVDSLSEMSTSWANGTYCYCKANKKYYILISGAWKNDYVKADSTTLYSDSSRAAYISDTTKRSPRPDSVRKSHISDTSAKVNKTYVMDTSVHSGHATYGDSAGHSGHAAYSDSSGHSGHATLADSSGGSARLGGYGKSFFDTVGNGALYAAIGAKRDTTSQDTGDVTTTGNNPRAATVVRLKNYSLPSLSLWAPAVAQCQTTNFIDTMGYLCYRTAVGGTPGYWMLDKYRKANSSELYDSLITATYNYYCGIPYITRYVCKASPLTYTYVWTKLAANSSAGNNKFLVSPKTVIGVQQPPEWDSLKNTDILFKVDSSLLSDTSKSSAQAAKLTTARTIGGVSFDGTAAIIPDTCKRSGTTAVADSTAKIPNNDTVKNYYFDSTFMSRAILTQLVDNNGLLVNGNVGNVRVVIGNAGCTTGKRGMALNMNSTVDGLLIQAVNNTFAYVRGVAAFLHDGGVVIGGTAPLTGYTFDVTGKSNFRDTVRGTTGILTGNLSLTAAGSLISMTGGGQTMTQTACPGIYLNNNAAWSQVTAENSSGIEGGFFPYSDGNFYMGSWSNSPLIFRTNNTNRITVSAAGVVTFTDTAKGTNLTMTGTVTSGGAAGFNGATAQTKKTVPAAVVPVSTTAATQLTPWGFATQGQADSLSLKINQLTTLVDSLRAALVNNGIAQ